MATIFRSPIITAIAVLSTTVAVNAQPTIQNRLILQPPPRSLKEFPNPARVLPPAPFVQDVRNRHVFLPAPAIRPNVQSEWPPPTAPIRSIVADAILNTNVSLPLPTGVPTAIDDWPTPQPPLARPAGQLHHRPQLGPIVAPPFSEKTWPTPIAAGRIVLVDPVRNGIVLPLPPVGTPFAQHEWPSPSTTPKKPETFLFYYIQDQTRPSFIQLDWPLPARVPSLIADPIPNRLTFPFVAPPAPFRQHDWPSASIVRIAKVNDPYNRNVFLPVPQGQPTHQHDWPRPTDPRSLLGSHTINDLGALSVPVMSPVRPVDWPIPHGAARPNDLEGLGAFIPRVKFSFRPSWATSATRSFDETFEENV